ncbi:mannan endo-1,4-beta-mannosidase [Fibrobacteres bacterium R8-0-B4]
MGRITLSVRIIAAIAVLTALAGPAAGQTPVRYEAEDATLANQAEVVPLASASGGKYVAMKGGDVSFRVNASAAGFYTIWAKYSQTCADSKIQNLVVNGTEVGTITFPGTGPFEGSTCSSPAFVSFKAAGKVKLSAGSNTVAIKNSWGWVDIDYIELGQYVAEPFNLSGSLVTPNASPNARKIYQFLREKFQNKVISGVMTDNTFQNNGQYTPHSINSQPEMAHIKSASGKLPVILGLDFMHSSGFKSGEQWFKGYTNAALALADSIFSAGGIPIFCWHWKDPLGRKESFYTVVGNPDTSKATDFDPAKIFTTAECTAPNTNSNEYKAAMADIDSISGLLKKLADKNIAVLWRPLHEAAGGWFWWGRDKKPKPCKALWRLMFDRMVNHHKLNNLIWVWTCEESGDALEWYPGDEYVDIIGRDIYPYPDQGARIHTSRVTNFEHLKELYSARKIIALSENGAIPHPDSLVADGAGWSWFMPWYGRFTTDVNTTAIWTQVMNHNYVITLDKMPGWANYQLSPTPICPGPVSPSILARPLVSVKSHRNTLELNVKGIDVRSVALYDLRGARIAVLSNDKLRDGTYKFSTTGLARQMCLVRIIGVDKKVTTLSVRIN